MKKDKNKRKNRVTEPVDFKLLISIILDSLVVQERICSNSTPVILLKYNAEML